MASRTQLLKNTPATSLRLAATGNLNNTTKTVDVTVNNSGSKAFLVGDIVSAFKESEGVVRPDQDAAARLGVVNSRSNTKINVTWGVLGTPVTAITGRAALGLAQRGGGITDVELGEDETADDNSVSVTGLTKTLAVTDSGIVQRVSKDANVTTLPAVAPGLTYIFVNDGDAAGSVGFSISPAAADHIDGGLLGVGVVNKDLINTKATSHPGDTVVLVGGAANTWNVARISGTFDKEA